MKEESRSFGGYMLFSTLLLLISCDNSFELAEQQGTIAGYEKFIEENPDHSNVGLAKKKVQTLKLSKARESQKIEDYDSYLKEYKSQKDSEEYKAAFLDLLELEWLNAEEEDNFDTYNKFIEKYEYTLHKRIPTAKKYRKVAKYNKDLVMEALDKEQVDTSKSSSKNCTAGGTESNGWMFTTHFTNNTGKDIKGVRAKVQFLDEDGKVIDEHATDSTVVIGDLYGRAYATPKRRKAPFKVGEKRQWCYITGDIPPNWSKKIKIRLLDLVFMND